MKRQRPVRLWAAAFWLLVWEGASLALAATTGGRMLLLASPVQALGRLLALAGTIEFWQAVAFSSLRILPPWARTRRPVRAACPATTSTTVRNS